MIGTIDVEVNAAHPNLPLCEFAAFVGSPSHVRVRNVPRGVGNWQITAVYLSANYPDNTSQTATLTHVGALWTGTIPGSAVAGRSVNGYQITADGLDESGNIITGYVLGAGDVVILDRDAAIVVGDTTYYLHLLDAVPETPHIGDVATVDGSLKLYDGSAWVSFAAGSSIEIVAPSTDPADEGKAADAYVTGIGLAAKQPTISDLDTIRSGAAAGATAYQKPQTGIPSSDMSSAVQTSLALADTAVRPAQLPYNLVQTITLGQLQDRAVQKVTLNAASTTLVLPALSDSDKVADFGLDVVNAYAESDTPTAASFQLDGTLGTDYNLIVPKGETWSDMTALAAGEMAVYYFTLSAFAIDNLPTWEVVKKVVELVPVPTAP